MGKNGEEDGAPLVTGPECCMCGDYGLSSMLFKCKQCRFRSQHKYCSNLYPEAESYNICNWCLCPKNEKVSKVSPNTSSDHHDNIKMNKKKRVLMKHSNGSIKDDESITKRHKFVPSVSRLIGKRIIRRTRSEEIPNDGKMIKKVFRNKVRRYKLLDEVST